VDPRAGLDNVKKRKFFTLPGLELRLLWINYVKERGDERNMWT
jgi:hypothetical protein